MVEERIALLKLSDLCILEKQQDTQDTVTSL